MRFTTVAVDYDGTLAKDGVVAPSTVEALERLVVSGRKLILVTGRILEELLPLFPQADLCSRIVAENGAVLYRPDTKERNLLSPAAPQSLIEALRRKHVVPLQVGDVIIATVRPHEVAALEAIRDTGLEHHVVFNRESVMILPPGVTKASGLQAALTELQVSAHNVVGIGDSENDHALFQAAELGVAVANAVSPLRDAADIVAGRENGEGTAEIVADLLADDLADRTRGVSRHGIPLGTTRDGRTLTIPPVGDNVLIAGTSGSGKSTLAHAILEQLIERGYQTCIIDPEGDYEQVEKAIVFGNTRQGPVPADVLTALDHPDAQIVINLVGLPLKDRPAFFMDLLPPLQARQRRTGRPHRILVDETHHLMPTTWRPGVPTLTDMTGMLFVTVHPEQLSPLLYERVTHVVTLGTDPWRTLETFARLVHRPLSTAPPSAVETGEALYWRTDQPSPPAILRTAAPRADRRRHRRKYAEGELPPDRSFYFRGPEGSLNLRAQNLIVFRQLADGVDDATWLHHLRRGDYSRWIESAIKDPVLASTVHLVELSASLPAQDSRKRVTDAIEARYTVPATGL